MSLTIRYNQTIFYLLLGSAVGCTASAFSIVINMLIFKQCGSWYGCSMGYGFTGIIFIFMVLGYKKLITGSFNIGNKKVVNTRLSQAKAKKD